MLIEESPRLPLNKSNPARPRNTKVVSAVPDLGGVGALVGVSVGWPPCPGGGVGVWVSGQGVFVGMGGEVGAGV